MESLPRADFDREPAAERLSRCDAASAIWRARGPSSRRRRGRRAPRLKVRSCTISERSARTLKPSTRACAAAGLSAPRGIADRARREAPRGDPGAPDSAGAAQRRLEADRRRDGAQGHCRGRGLSRRSRGLKATMPELEAAEREAAAALDAELAAIPNLPLARYAGRQGRERQCRDPPHGSSAGVPGRLQAQGAFRDRRGAGPHGFRRRGENVRRPLRRAEGRAGAARAGARAIHARPAHERAWLFGDRAAGPGARRGDVRHGATAEVRGRSVLGGERRGSARADRRRDRASRSA